MTRDETLAMLRIRRDATRESFNDGTVDAWHAALGRYATVDVRTALAAACREHEHVVVAHVVEHLPRRWESTQVPFPDHPCGCPGDRLCEHDIQRNLAGIARGRDALQAAAALARR